MLKWLRTIISKTAEYFGYYVGILPPSADTTENHLVLLCDRFNVNCVIDVGAHFGEFATRLRKAGYKGRIVSWEPVRENFVKLKELSANDSNWFVHNAALGDSTGTSAINVNVATDCSSFLQPSAYGKEQFHGKLELQRTEEVEIKTLSDVFDQCVEGISKPKVFLKVDAQGFDINVFEGAKYKLSEICGLQAEMSVQHVFQGTIGYKDFMEILNKKGFVLSGIFPVRVDRLMRLIEIDCIMVREK